MLCGSPWWCIRMMGTPDAATTSGERGSNVRPETSFTSRAPAAVVERERAKAEDLERALARLEALRSGFGS